MPDGAYDGPSALAGCLQLAAVDAWRSPRAPAVAAVLLARGAPMDWAIAVLGRERDAGEIAAAEGAVVRLLIDAGASPDQLLCEASSAGDVALTTYLLGEGAPVDATCDGRTALGAAVAGCHVSLVDLLIDRGASVVHGPKPAMHLALRCKDVDRSRTIIARLLAAGADRASLDANELTVYSGASSEEARRLIDVAPLSAAEEAALLVAWAHDRVEDDLVAAIPAAQAGRVRMLNAVLTGGDVGFIASYAAVGTQGFADLLTGPFWGPMSHPGSVPWPCAIDGGASLRAVSAAVGPGTSDERSGPTMAREHGATRTGWLRTGPLWRLAWIEPDGACDPFGGAMVGLPRAMVRAGLGHPLVAWPDADVFEADGISDWGDREPWILVRYEGGVVSEWRIDWRYW